MAQSINSTVELTTTGVSYLGMGGKVGKFLLGNKGLEFYSDANVEDYIQECLESLVKQTFLGKILKKSEQMFLAIKSAVTLKSLLTKVNFFLPQKIQERF